MPLSKQMLVKQLHLWIKGLSFEMEFVILAGMMMGSMFLCTAIISHKLDNSKRDRIEQIALLRGIKDDLGTLQNANVGQAVVNGFLQQRLEAIQTELDAVKAGQADTLTALRTHKVEVKQLPVVVLTPSPVEKEKEKKKKEEEEPQK